MQSKLVEYITSNGNYVRLRIFDGDLQISEAGAELLRIEKAQHEATRRELVRKCETLAAVRRELTEVRKALAARAENIEKTPPAGEGGGV